MIGHQLDSAQRLSSDWSPDPHHDQSIGRLTASALQPKRGCAPRWLDPSRDCLTMAILVAAVTLGTTPRPTLVAFTATNAAELHAHDEHGHEHVRAQLSLRFPGASFEATLVLESGQDGAEAASIIRLDYRVSGRCSRNHTAPVQPGPGKRAIEATRATRQRWRPARSRCGTCGWGRLGDRALDVGQRRGTAGAEGKARSGLNCDLSMERRQFAGSWTIETPAAESM